MHTRVALAGAIVVATGLAACGGSDTVTSPTIDTVASSVPATTVSSTAPSSTAPTSTPAPTTGPATTQAPATTAPTTAPPATTTPGTDPAGPLPATFFVAEDTDLVERSTADGGIVRVVAEFFNGDGVFRSFIRLAPDRSSIFYSEAYEDGWYSCESSVGVVGRLDVTTGELETLAPGAGIELSADGATTVHLGSDVCVPDPSSPDLWVFTPYDRVVVTDLASGATTAYLTDVPPDSYEAPSAVDWAGIADDGSILVLTADDVLRRIPAGATGAIQDHPVLLDGVTALPLEVVGDVLYVVEAGDEGSADLFAIDLGDGTRTLLASAEASMTAGASPQGRLIATAFAPITVEPGADLTVVEPPDEQTFFYEVDW